MKITNRASATVQNLASLVNPYGGEKFPTATSAEAKLFGGLVIQCGGEKLPTATTPQAKLDEGIWRYSNAERRAPIRDRVYNTVVVGVIKKNTE